MENQIPRIKVDCTEMGLHVEATLNGTDWVTVQLTKYKTRSSRSVMQYSTCIDPAMDRAEYFAELRARGIQFIEVKC
jgi:hypothetical protein